MENQQEDGGQDVVPTDVEEEVEPAGFDWPVFLARATGLAVIGAALITAVDASLNAGLDWVNVMRTSVLPFSAGALIMVGAELMDRLGD